MYIERLKQLRKEKRISQQEMADRIGVRKSQYASWEESCNVPPKYLEAVSRILGQDFVGMKTLDSETLRIMRLVAGLSQKEVANELGVTQQSIDFWEKNPDADLSKYEERLLQLFKEKLTDKPIIPMTHKTAPGIKVFEFLDQECYILLDCNADIDILQYQKKPGMTYHIYREVEN